MTQDEAKALVAKRAVEFVEDGMAVGLGTGTTATMFIRALGEKVKAGLKIRCVASSDASTALGQSLGMDVVTLAELPQLDIYIDGADEVAPGLALIKGGGAAMLREKIVASASARQVIVADAPKLVDRLGATVPVPIEVAAFGWQATAAALRARGVEPRLREQDGSPVLTDGGNLLLDCRTDPINDPAEAESRLRGVVGVLEVGLFVGLATEAFIADADGIRHLEAR